MNTNTQYFYTAFVRGSGFSSKLIEWFGGGHYSHVAGVLPSNPNFVLDARSDIIDGVPAGVQKRPISYLKQYNVDWVGIKCSAAQLKNIEAAMVSQLEKPYDSQGIINFAFGSMRDRNWKDESAWFCSEFWTWYMIQGNRCGKLLLPVNVITPGTASCIAGALGGVPAWPPGVH